MNTKKKVAILTEEGFEQVELTNPREALEQAGIETVVISPEKKRIRAWNHTDWGIEIDTDLLLKEADPDSYDALLIPGGVLNPDKLRANTEAVDFVKNFLQSGKPVAAICHGPQVLIETGMLGGRKMTSYHSVKTDLKNAGAEWQDAALVRDGNLITSRDPGDLPEFNAGLLKAIRENGS